MDRLRERPSVSSLGSAGPNDHVAQTAYHSRQDRLPLDHDPAPTPGRQASFSPLSSSAQDRWPTTTPSTRQNHSSPPRDGDHGNTDHCGTAPPSPSHTSTMANNAGSGQNRQYPSAQEWSRRSGAVKLDHHAPPPVAAEAFSPSKTNSTYSHQAALPQAGPGLPRSYPPLDDPSLSPQPARAQDSSSRQGNGGSDTSQRFLGGLTAPATAAIPATQSPFQLMPSPYAKASVDMHSPSLGLGSNASTPEFSVFVGDLSPDLREEDLVTQFLHPPPWPPNHPFAIAYAHARKMQGEPAPADEVFGPQPFLSTKSAKIMTDPATGASKGFGFVRFTNEADCKRAFVEMQGVILSSASGASPGRPVRISAASVRQKSGSASPAQQPAADNNNSHSLHPAESPGFQGVPRDNGSDGTQTPPFQPSASLSLGSSPLANKYSSPTPESIAMQSSRSPYPRLGVPTLPGFPTIPATGALGPTDVGLSSGVMVGSNFGGPASLAGTGFTLGPSTLPSPTSALDPNNTTVFVGGLSSLISEETLKTFFAPFGMIAYVKIPPGKGCGFVSFTQKVDAERAIERMQGFPIGGCRIRLSWGRSQGEKNQHLAAQHIATIGQVANYRNDGSNVPGLASLTPQQAAQLARVANWSGISSSSQFAPSATATAHGAGYLDSASDPYFGTFGGYGSTGAGVPSSRGGLTFDTGESRRLPVSSTGSSPGEELSRFGMPPHGGPPHSHHHHPTHSLSAADFSTGSDLTSLFGGLGISQSSPAQEKWSSPWAPTPNDRATRWNDVNTFRDVPPVGSLTGAAPSSGGGSLPVDGSDLFARAPSSSSSANALRGDEESTPKRSLWYESSFEGRPNTTQQQQPLSTRGSSSSLHSSKSAVGAGGGGGTSLGAIGSFTPFSPISRPAERQAQAGEGASSGAAIGGGGAKPFVPERERDRLRNQDKEEENNSSHERSDYEHEGFFHPGLRG